MWKPLNNPKCIGYFKYMSVTHPDRLMGCSDCLLLLTGSFTLELSVDSDYKRVYRCTQSLQCYKLYQTVGNLQCII